jgi:hypothetical protein
MVPQIKMRNPARTKRPTYVSVLNDFIGSSTQHAVRSTQQENHLV